MKKFFWGVATSSFQIEGHINNDFTEWEKEGKFKKGELDPVYDNGSNHWLMWKEDFDLLEELRVNAYRFSLEWSRIQPELNHFSEEALDQYERMVDYLLEKKIEPFLTLHHFTHPLWFHKISPWHTENSVEVFYNYVEKILSRFKDRIKYWITFNEPLVWVMAGYGEGNFPPGIKNLETMMIALSNILEAHRNVYDLIKSVSTKSQIGIAKHFIFFKSERDWFLLDKAVRNRINQFFNKMVLDAFVTNKLVANLPTLLKFEKEINLNNKIDFWGVNYYYRLFTKFRLSLDNPFHFYTKHPETDTGWEIYSKGIYKILKLVSNYGKPIIVTENGIAINDEEIRKKFLKKHLKFVFKAIKNNIDVRGYFYWSLIDNYEWLYGKSKRFGLVFVDYENNFKRIPKESFYFYKELIQTYSQRLKSLEREKLKE